MAQDSAADSPEVAALKKQIARENAAKAEAEALKARADARKAVFEEQKAAADAEAAAIAAQQAALKAKFGVVAGSSTATGVVEIGEGGGNGEASLLAARAVGSAARYIYDAVKKSAAIEARCIVYAGTQRPALGHWWAFRVQLQIAQDAFTRADDARTLADEAARVKAVVREAAEEKEFGAAFTTAAGAVLDLGAKLGSYFQSDYKSMGATIAGSDDDLLATTVCGLLHNSWYPAKWMPSQGEGCVRDLLNPVATSRNQSVARLKSVQQRADQLKADAEKEADATEKARLTTLAANYTQAVEAYTAAQKRFDDLLVSLATVDKDGVPLVAHVVNEKTLSDAIDEGSFLLFVRLNAPVGGRYTKKNLWTFFGCMPFYISGGAIASFVLIEGKSGQVKAGGQFEVHSGYGKIKKVVEPFASRPPSAH